MAAAPISSERSETIRSAICRGDSSSLARRSVSSMIRVPWPCGSNGAAMALDGQFQAIRANDRREYVMIPRYADFVAVAAKAITVLGRFIRDQFFRRVELPEVFVDYIGHCVLRNDASTAPIARMILVDLMIVSPVTQSRIPTTIRPAELCIN